MALRICFSTMLVLIVLSAYGYVLAEDDVLKQMIKENEQAVPIVEYLEFLRTNVPSPKSDEPLHYAELRLSAENFRSCTALSKLMRSLSQEITETEVGSYVSECLSPIGHPSLFAMRDNLIRVVGVMKIQLFGIEKIECTVVRIGLNILMTARHCFDSHGLMDEAGNISDTNVREYARFYLASAPSLPITPKTVIENSYYSNPEHRNGSKRNHRQQFDYVLVETDKIDIPFHPIAFAIPNELDKVIIPGVSVLTLQFEEQKLAQQGLEAIDDPGQWAHALRWDNSPTCVIARLIGACIYHGCQTERKVSGAPIFRYTQNGAIVLLGIHTRTATNMNDKASRYDCPLPEKVLAMGNGGIALTSEMITLMEHHDR
ncbi:MAG: hypothetical protein H8K03_09355 [Nitrospira sp.]